MLILRHTNTHKYVYTFVKVVIKAKSMKKYENDGPFDLVCSIFNSYTSVTSDNLIANKCLSSLLWHLYVSKDVWIKELYYSLFKTGLHS